MDSTRGTGRTTKALLSVPKGGYFIIHSAGMKSCCKNILKQHGRSISDVKFLVYTRCKDAEHLRSLPRNMIRVDHYVWENPHLSEHRKSCLTHTLAQLRYYGTNPE